MKVWFPFWLLDTTSEVCEEAASGGISPVFLVIVGLAVLGIVIMILQNFVWKKEEYYK